MIFINKSCFGATNEVRGQRIIGVMRSEVKVEVRLVWQCSSPGDEGVIEGVVKEVVQRGCVQVGEGRQTSAEVSRALLCAKHAAKPHVVGVLQ